VRYLPGVKGVSNKITLKPSVQPTAVKAAIEKALKRNAEIDAEDIKGFSRWRQGNSRRYGPLLG
jgi:osmotically-inducible protein OsmY